MKAENAIIIALIILIFGAAAVAFIITESGLTFNQPEDNLNMSVQLNNTTNATNIGEEPTETRSSADYESGATYSGSGGSSGYSSSGYSSDYSSQSPSSEASPSPQESTPTDVDTSSGQSESSEAGQSESSSEEDFN